MLEKMRTSLLVLAFVSLSLSGCYIDTLAINGTWFGIPGDYQDAYVINDAEKKLIFYSTIADKTIGYTGNIVTSSNMYEETGFITIQVTESNASWYPSVDKYSVIRWQEFNSKDGTIKMAGNYKTDGYSAMDTAEEAEEEFTIENGYYSIFGDYTESEE